MTRRRPTRGFEPVTLGATDLATHMPYLRAVLRTMGAPAQDEEDLVHEITAAAWTAILAARFRPDPTLPREVAVKRWLGGIARRQVGTHRQRTGQRHHRNLRSLYGSWACLADAMGVRRGSLENVAHGVKPVSGGMALRAGKAAGKPLERLIGEPVSADRCPHCGASKGAP